MGIILGLLAPPGAPFGGPGASWGSFGASWSSSGALLWLLWASWGLLGLILGVLGPPGAHFGPPGASWGSFWASWRLLGLILSLLRLLWALLGLIWGSPWASKMAPKSLPGGLREPNRGRNQKLQNGSKMVPKWLPGAPPGSRREPEAQMVDFEAQKGTKNRQKQSK